MKIKFDRKTAKTAKYCALICTVLLIIGVVLSFLEIDGTEFFYTMTIYASMLVGLACYVVFFSAKLYFAFFALFLLVDVIYLIKWHFMKDTCLFMFVVCLVLDIVWLILAMILRRQRNTEKYRDDVECDKTRKERLNLENIIVFAIF